MTTMLKTNKLETIGSAQIVGNGVPVAFDFSRSSHLIHIEDILRSINQSQERFFMVEKEYTISIFGINGSFIGSGFIFLMDHLFLHVSI